MSKIILNLAISLDGYIADLDGGFDWIKGHNDRSQDTNKKFDFEEFSDSVDVIVMGSKAYEDSPENSLDAYKEKKILVASSRKLDVEKNVEVVNGDVCGRVLELKETVEKDIWLYGGGVLIEAFSKQDIIDEYIVGIIPVVLGKGRPLFASNIPKVELHLDECIVDDGITLLRYSRNKPC